MLTSLLSTSPSKCSFSLLTLEFSVPVKLFSVQANEGAEIKATSADAKFSAVSKRTHMQDPLQQRPVELKYSSLINKCWRRSAWNRGLHPDAHRNHLGCFKNNWYGGKRSKNPEWFQCAAPVQNPCPGVGASPASLFAPLSRHLLWEFPVSFPMSIVWKYLIT